MLLAYLGREEVRSPMQYVCVSAKVQRQWLPLLYFVHFAGRDRDAAIAELEATNAVYRVSKEYALERLRGLRFALERPGGAVVQVFTALQAGEFDNLRERFSDFQIARGIRGLPNGIQPDLSLFNLLREIYREAGDDANVRSSVFSAAARLDELEHAGLHQ